MKSFAGLLATSFGISRTLHRKGRSQSLKLMKTFLTVSVFAAIAAITFHAAAQTPPPPPPPPPAAATTPALPPPPGVATSPGAPGAVASPAAPGVMPSPALGVPGAPATSPAAPGAMQVAAGIEIKRAGRFLVVMDTLVTLAPLLGLLGTITGLIRSFSFLGNEELAVQAVTGGIAEALIATACGLGIAIFSLIPFNFFTSRVSNLEFELQTAATNLEVMLEAKSKEGHEMAIGGHTPSSAKGSSI